MNREIWLQLREKQRVSDHWKKGQTTLEDHRVVMRLCREKNRRDKVYLEINLASLLKENRKCFNKYISKVERSGKGWGRG